MVDQWQSGLRRGIDGEAGWEPGSGDRRGARRADDGEAPGERTTEWTTKRAGRTSGRPVSRAPANHGDVDEGGPQLLALVNAASAPSSHGQVPQTGWGSVQEEAKELYWYGSVAIKLTHQPLRSELKSGAK